MDFKKMNLTTGTVLKIAGLAVVAIIVVVIGVRFIGSSLKSIVPGQGVSYAPAFDASYGGMSEKAMYDEVALSTRNVMPTESGTTTGDNAEEFEVKEYYASVETRKLEDDCAKVAELKARTDVIFENVNSYDKGCSFTFKVKKDSVAEVLGIIKALDPKELQENTYTIKNQIEDFTSEIDILNKKLTSIDETLGNAIDAYNEVTKLATTVRDVESLAKIIDSKINLIERLTSERLQVSNRLEAISRAKAIQLDRVDYTYFNVNIYENKFIDWKDLKDSWKTAVQEFVLDVNQVIQDISINLVAMIFYVLQFLLYFFLLFIIAKYVWKFAKYLWNK